MKTTIYMPCGKCGEEKPVEEFASKSGHTTYGMCRTCRQEYSREWMKRKLSISHAEVWNILIDTTGHRCARCAYREFSAALEFVPIPGIDPSPSTPLHNLVNRFCYYATEANWDILLDKLQGQVLLCANCHQSLRAGKWHLLELDILGPIIRHRPKMPVAQDASPHHSPDASPTRAPG